MTIVPTKSQGAAGFAVAAVLIHSAWAPAHAAPPGVLPDRILLGQSAKLSGTSGTELGRQYRDGLLLAFEAANRSGGVNGRKLELVSFNDGNNAEAAKANTRKLLDSGVFALVGYTFSGPVRAALPMARESDTPLVGPYAAMPELYESPATHVFMFRASASDELAAIVRHIDTVGYQDVAMVHYANPLGEDMRKEVSGRLQAIGRRLVAIATMQITPADSDKAAQPAVAAMASPSCPKVVFLGVSGRDAAAVIRGMRAAGCGSVRYFARNLVDIPTLVKELGPAARGVMVTQVVPNPHRGAHPLVMDYREQQSRKDPSAKPDFTEFEGYIVGRFIVQALQRSGPDLDRARFMRAMEAASLDGPGGYRVHFGAGKRVGSRYTNFVMVSEAGRITD
jgi:ABC-type branched-subunit amino acid transport system substrate-binding protein